MTLESFTRALETFGSDIESWPDNSRSVALDLMSHNEDARFLLEQAESLDALLHSSPDIVSSSALRETILAGGLSATAGQLPKDIRASEVSAGILSRLWDRFLEPTSVPALAVWALVATLGIASGAALSTGAVSDEELLAFYGGGDTVWSVELGQTFEASEENGT